MTTKRSRSSEESVPQLAEGALSDLGQLVSQLGSFGVDLRQSLGDALPLLCDIVQGGHRLSNQRCGQRKRLRPRITHKWQSQTRKKALSGGFNQLFGQTVTAASRTATANSPPQLRRRGF